MSGPCICSNQYVAHLLTNETMSWGKFHVQCGGACKFKVGRVHVLQLNAHEDSDRDYRRFPAVSSVVIENKDAQD